MSSGRRRSVRLRHHDYLGGLYFVTLCTFGRQRLFGNVTAGEMERSPFGEIVHEEWVRTMDARASAVQDAFVVMPDHLHALFGILSPPDDETKATHDPVLMPCADPPLASGPSPGSVGAVVGQFKPAVTRRIRFADPAVRVWQRGYHDRVVRSEHEAEAIRRYIAENPARWADLRPGRPDGHRL